MCTFARDFKNDMVSVSVDASQQAVQNISQQVNPSPFVEGLVSVVMPVHNSARFLREAIESVLDQTYQNWELLIVDDASKDDSINIAHEYEEKDKRIHVLKNDAPIGIPSAPRNVGITAARGRYVAFLDSDDIWFPRKLEQQIPLLSEQGTAIAFGNYEKMEEDGRRRNRVVRAPATASYKSLLNGNVIGNLTGMYDRKQTGTVLMPDRRHEDYVMWLSILKRGFVARNTGTVLGAYRLRSTSVSSQKMLTVRWQWAIYREVEGLSWFSSAYHFMFYAFKAFCKRLI